jgi:hypothetical protein
LQETMQRSLSGLRTIMNEETGKWVVTVFLEYEPSRVYGLFNSEEEAIAWAESNREDWDAMAVHQLREAV